MNEIDKYLFGSFLLIKMIIKSTSWKESGLYNFLTYILTNFGKKQKNIIVYKTYCWTSSLKMNYYRMFRQAREWEKKVSWLD